MVSVRVIIFGTHTDSWNTALASEAAVWKRIPEVQCVERFDKIPAARPPESIKENRQVIIPLMERHIRQCPNNYQSLKPDLHSLSILENKANFGRYMQQSGLKRFHPHIYSSIDEVEFPCVLKKIDLNGGNGIFILNSEAEFFDKLKEKNWTEHDYILQQYVSGQDHVTHCIFKKGEMLENCSFIYERIDPAQITQASNILRCSPFAPSSRLLDKIISILAPLNYSGPCNVDYRILPSDDIMVLEINPRLGGSLMGPKHVEYLADQLSCLIQNAHLDA